MSNKSVGLCLAQYFEPNTNTLRSLVNKSHSDPNLHHSLVSQNLDKFKTVDVHKTSMDSILDLPLQHLLLGACFSETGPPYMANS